MNIGRCEREVWGRSIYRCIFWWNRPPEGEQCDEIKVIILVIIFDSLARRYTNIVSCFRSRSVQVQYVGLLQYCTVRRCVGPIVIMSQLTDVFLCPSLQKQVQVL